jgi:hypothetical protein
MDDKSIPRNAEVVREQIPTPVISDEIWKLILDRSKTPEMLIHLLKGEVWITRQRDKEITGAWERKGEPLMNDKGIRFFTTFLYSSSMPDKLVTFITEEEVNRLVREMIHAIIYIIQERGDEFDIAASNRSYITRLLEQNYFLSLTASRKGTILAALKPMYTRQEIYNPSQKERRFGMPSFLGGQG